MLSKHGICNWFSPFQPLERPAAAASSSEYSGRLCVFVCTLIKMKTTLSRDIIFTHCSTATAEKKTSTKWSKENEKQAQPWWWWCSFFCVSKYLFCFVFFFLLLLLLLLLWPMPPFDCIILNIHDWSVRNSSPNSLHTFNVDGANIFPRKTIFLFSIEMKERKEKNYKSIFKRLSLATRKTRNEEEEENSKWLAQKLWSKRKKEKKMKSAEEKKQNVSLSRCRRWSRGSKRRKKRLKVFSFNVF